MDDVLELLIEEFATLDGIEHEIRSIDQFAE